MEEKLKEIMRLHKLFAEKIACREKDVPLAKQLLQKEIDAFNGLYFCGNSFRCNVVAAIMEQYIGALKAQGVYDEGLVANTKVLMGSAFIPGGTAK